LEGLEHGAPGWDRDDPRERYARDARSALPADRGGGVPRAAGARGADDPALRAHPARCEPSGGATRLRGGSGAPARYGRPLDPRTHRVTPTEGLAMTLFRPKVLLPPFRGLRGRVIVTQLGIVAALTAIATAPARSGGFGGLGG